MASLEPRWVLLAGNEDAATLIAVLRQLLDSLTPESTSVDLEVIDAAPQTRSLLQALA